MRIPKPSGVSRFPTRTVGRLPFPLTALWALFAASLLLALSVGPPPASAGTARSQTYIACYHEKIDRFSAETHPERCNIWGNRGQQFLGISVRHMNWRLWGANRSRASYGFRVDDHAAVRVIAHRPIVCSDGRRWYSKVVVFFPVGGEAFVFRMPTCDRSVERAFLGWRS
jgi:hypothetical protein